MSEQITENEGWSFIGPDGKVPLPDGTPQGLTVFRADVPTSLDEDPALQALERNYPPKAD